MQGLRMSKACTQEVEHSGDDASTQVYLGHLGPRAQSGSHIINLGMLGPKQISYKFETDCKGTCS